MAEYAPWLVSPWLPAMTAGAQVGMELRRTGLAEREAGLRDALAVRAQDMETNRQDMVQQEAADRLRFAYSQLGFQNLRAREEDQLRREIAAQEAANRLLAIRESGLARAAALDRSNLGLAEQQRHNRQLELAAALRLAATGAHKTIHAPGIGIYDFDPASNEWKLKVPFPNKPFASEAPTITIDQFGNLVEAKGGATNPTMVKLQSDLQAKRNTEKAGKSAGWSLLRPGSWFGSRTTPSTPVAPTVLTPTASRGQPQVTWRYDDKTGELINLLEEQSQDERY